MILSETLDEAPDTYKDIVARAGNTCNTADRLVKKTREIIGLRNIIVHLYADTDYNLVLGELESIVDNLLEFTSNLVKCIKRLGIDL